MSEPFIAGLIDSKGQLGTIKRPMMIPLREVKGIVFFAVDEADVVVNDKGNGLKISKLSFCEDHFDAANVIQELFGED